MHSRMFHISKKVLYVVMLAVFCSAQLSFAQADTWQWTEPTPGQKNASTQVKASTSATTVIINELSAFSTSTQKEYVELYNYGAESLFLKGWKLVDKSGSTYTFGDVALPGKGYYTVLGSVSLNNDGDIITLKSPDGEVRDEISYASTDTEKGKSLSRFCDVYELLFCSLESATQTPGSANVRIVLTVSTEKQDGAYTYGTLIRLVSNDPAAKIFYTFDAKSASEEDFHLYRGPFELVDKLDIYFYAMTEGRSSALMESHFTVATSSKGRKSYDVSLNELYSGSGDLLGNQAWVEIRSKNKQKISLAGWVLTADPRGICESYNSCVRFQEKTMLVPNGMISYDVPADVFKKGAIYLFDKEKYVVDELHFSDFSGNGSLIRLPEKYRVINNYNSDVALQWTHFPTKGKENVLALVLSKKEDADGDFLSTKEEKSAHTDAKLFDTNANMLPDFFDRGEAMNNSDMFLYKKLLSDAVYASVVDHKVTGRSFSHATIHFFLNEHTEVGSVNTDDQGKFTWDAPNVPTTALYYMIVEDQNHVQGFPGDSLVIKNAAEIATIKEGSMRITRILPNPDGVDDTAKEWIEIQNVSSSAIVMSSLQVKIKTHTYALKGESLAPGASRIITAKELNGTFPNSTTIIMLTDTSGKIIDQVTMPSAEKGEIIVFQKSTAVKANVTTKGKATKTAVIKKPATTLVATGATLPSLTSIQEEDTLPSYPTYAPSVLANIQPQDTLTLSSTFSHTSSSEAESNVVLALLGGFLSSMGGLIFWKF